MLAPRTTCGFRDPERLEAIGRRTGVLGLALRELEEVRELGGICLGEAHLERRVRRRSERRGGGPRPPPPRGRGGPPPRRGPCRRGLPVGGVSSPLVPGGRRYTPPGPRRGRAPPARRAPWRWASHRTSAGPGRSRAS